MRRSRPIHSTTRSVRGPTAAFATAIAGALPLFLLAAVATPTAARAQGDAAPPRCHVLCAPTVTLMPGVLRTHVARAPLVRTTSTGAEHRLEGSTTFEAIVAAASRTALPRVSAFASVQWLPNASESHNPFTLYTANELGTGVHANAPTVTVGGSVALLTPQQSRGWLDVAANVGDLFSQAARPDDRRAYTHKLDLDLVAHAHAFAWANAHSWLHGASLYAILDYVATGLPRAGDEVPVGRVFVTDARPMALVAGLALPLTSQAPR